MATENITSVVDEAYEAACDTRSRLGWDMRSAWARFSKLADHLYDTLEWKNLLADYEAKKAAFVDAVNAMAILQEKLPIDYRSPENRTAKRRYLDRQSSEYRPEFYNV